LVGGFGSESFWIFDGVAEEVEEEGLSEVVEFGAGGAAFGPQGLGLVQHRGDAALLRQRREWHW
jgi:hypothetical protein